MDTLTIKIVLNMFYLMYYTNLISLIVIIKSFLIVLKQTEYT